MPNLGNNYSEFGILDFLFSNLKNRTSKQNKIHELNSD